MRHIKIYSIIERLTYIFNFAFFWFLTPQENPPNNQYSQEHKVAGSQHMNQQEEAESFMQEEKEWEGGIEERHARDGSLDSDDFIDQVRKERAREMAHFKLRQPSSLVKYCKSHHVSILYQWELYSMYPWELNSFYPRSHCMEESATGMSNCYHFHKSIWCGM